MLICIYKYYIHTVLYNIQNALGNLKCKFLISSNRFHIIGNLYWKAFCETQHIKGPLSHYLRREKALK